MELKEIKAIIDLMTKNGLTEFELEKGDVKVRIKRGPAGESPSVTMIARENGGSVILQPVVPLAAPGIPQPASSPTASVPAASPDQFKEIKSPMVGTFFRYPSPEAAPYIEIGQPVTEETVVCIVEAMKVMNEIKAEVRGVITEILVENAKPVEFGKPLFRVKVA